MFVSIEIVSNPPRPYSVASLVTCIPGRLSIQAKSVESPSSSVGFVFSSRKPAIGRFAIKNKRPEFANVLRRFANVFSRFPNVVKLLVY